MQVAVRGADRRVHRGPGLIGPGPKYIRSLSPRHAREHVRQNFVSRCFFFFSPVHLYPFFFFNFHSHRFFFSLFFSRAAFAFTRRRSLLPHAAVLLFSLYGFSFCFPLNNLIIIRALLHTRITISLVDPLCLFFRFFAPPGSANRLPSREIRLDACVLVMVLAIFAVSLWFFSLH